MFFPPTTRGARFSSQPCKPFLGILCNVHVGFFFLTVWFYMIFSLFMDSPIPHGMRVRWAYHRSISAELVIFAHPSYEEKKFGEGVITGIKIQDVVKEDILKKIISSYVSSHLSKCCHQNPGYLHRLE